MLALIASLTAYAGSFTATPIKLTLDAGATSTSLSLINTGDAPVLVQAELVAWSQADGKEVLTPSLDLVVSPPIFKVAPGAVQIVRVGVLQRTPSDREVTYRLFLQEVPAPRRPGEQGINVALRLGLSIFVLPPGGAAPQLSWHARGERGDIRLTLTNSGNGHAQAVDCKLYREDGTLLAEQPLGAYVLAGQMRSWIIKPKQPWGGGKLRVVAQTSAGPVTAEIVSQ